MLIAMPVLYVLFKIILPTLPSNPMLKEAFWAKKVLADASYDLVLIGERNDFSEIVRVFLIQQ